MKTRRNTFLWILYDFANSIVSIVFFLYFAQWIVIERGVSDFGFNLTFTIAAILLLLTAPLAGTLLDKSWRRISGLRIATAFTVLFYGACALFAVNNQDLAALICFTLGLYSYLLSFTFYSPLLNDISTPKKRGLVSGLGITANYLGQFVGLLIALPFSKGTIHLFSGTPRSETLLPAVIVFALIALPTLIFFQEPKAAVEKLHVKSAIKHLFSETKILLGFPSLVLFLLSYFLFNDAVLTAANNFPIFMQQVWQASDTVKTYVLLGILITSAIGGTCSGLLADKFGHKRTLMGVLIAWLFVLPAVGLLTDFTLFVIATTLMGFLLGANWAVSRSVMSYIAPAGKHNLAFAFYGLAERASSLIGPIIWGLIVTGLFTMGSDRYRIAVLAITGFIFLGLIALSRVPDDKKEPVHIPSI